MNNGQKRSEYLHIRLGQDDAIYASKKTIDDEGKEQTFLI